MHLQLISFSENCACDFGPRSRLVLAECDESNKIGHCSFFQKTSLTNQLRAPTLCTSKPPAPTDRERKSADDVRRASRKNTRRKEPRTGRKRVKRNLRNKDAQEEENSTKLIEMELCNGKSLSKTSNLDRQFVETKSEEIHEQKEGRTSGICQNLVEKSGAPAAKTSVVPKRPGIASKLIKKAVLEARKESGTERKKRPVPFMCNLCLTKFSMVALKEHLTEHCTLNGEELKCNLCDKILMCGNRIISFNSHLRLHGNMHHFLCSICGTGFKSEGAYKYHREMHKNKRHTCEVCEKSFKARGLLRSHMMTHSAVKSHICEYCAKGFRTATLLSKHVMIHTGEKPHRCDECGAEFRMSSHLRRHKDVHAGKKMFVCSVCNHAVYQRTNMRVHMKVHTGVRYSPIYVCKKCKMAFSSQDGLEEHATGCNLTESVYEQQQRLGLLQKPPPLRVKKSKQTKTTTSQEIHSQKSDPVPAVLNFVDDALVQVLAQQPIVSDTNSQQQILQRGNSQGVSSGTTDAERVFASQQFSTNSPDLPQPEVPDLVQQTQFLQLHTHQLYPPFYMQ